MKTPYRVSRALEEYCLGRIVGAVGIARLATVKSLAAAEARIKELAKIYPGKYIIFCRSTGRVVAQFS